MAVSLTAAKEKLLRDAWRALVATSCADAFFVFVDRPLVNSKADFVEQFFKPETQHAGGSVVKYALIEFQQFTDLDAPGCEDNPTARVQYNCHAFVETYGPTGAAADNSNNELAAFVLNLRAAILLAGLEITLSDLSEHTLYPLEQASFIITDEDPLTGIAGTYCDLTLAAEIV